MAWTELVFEIENCVLDICHGADTCEIIEGIVGDCCGLGIPVTGGALYSDCSEYSKIGKKHSGQIVNGLEQVSG